MDCELTADLVGACVPGDLVTVTGIVKVATDDQGRLRLANVTLTRGIIGLAHPSRIPMPKGS